MIKKMMLALVAMAAMQMSGTVKIAIMSDIHTMSERLVVKDGAAIEKYAASDSRMVRQSADILSTAIGQITAQHPDVVMISGDLTKDGERVSHELMASQLERLKAKGIKVLVIPGNHDISNANAKYYDGDDVRPAATINRNEFRQIYQHFGYGNDAVTDSASLSYAIEPVKGLVVIGIDSNRDEENLLIARGDSIDTYHTAGRIKASTLQWIADRAREARAQGKRVVAMMHHHLIEHFDSEARLLKNYVVADNERVAHTLVEAGIHTIFTGHLHISDIARAYIGGDSITEVATGSMVFYPFHYRTATINLADSTISIGTHQIERVPSCPSLLLLGKRRVEKGASGLFGVMINKMVAKLESASKKISKYTALLGGSAESFDFSKKKAAIKALCHEKFDSLATRACVMLLDGNEGRNPQSKPLIASFENAAMEVVSEVLPKGVGDMLQGFIEENVLPRLHTLLCSMLEDRNHCDTPSEVTVDDLNATFRF